MALSPGTANTIEWSPVARGFLGVVCGRVIQSSAPTRYAIGPG
jgi:hypothetical protein